MTRAAITHEVGADHPMLAGHFPGNPIVPGAWLLAQVIDDATAWLARHESGRTLAGVKSVKFLQPVRPQQRFTIEFTEGSGTLKFTIALDGMRCATGVLELADAR